MEKFKKIDIDFKYKVKLNFNESISYDSLFYCYAPLLGPSAVSFYLLLFNESKNPFINNIFISQNRLICLMNKNVISLEKYIFKLESLGLIKVYINPASKEKTTFVLLKPLSTDKFLNNENLSSLLRKKIGVENLIITSKPLNFRTFEQDENLVLITKEIKLNSKDIEEPKKNINIKFNFDLIYEFLDKKGINYLYWNDELKQKIIDLIFLYNLSALEIVEFIIEIETDNKTLTPELLSELVKANKEVSLNNFDKILNQETATKETQIEIFKNYSPSDLIYIQNDREPNKEEEELILSLKKEYNLTDELINILFNHSHLVNGAIIPNYIYKISKTIIKNNILTSTKLINHLKVAHKVSKKELFKKKKEINTKEEIEIFDNFNFEEVDFE